MRLTPAYLVAVATFYDMLDTRPVGRHRVYVCTNISCSLRGADELLDAIEQRDGRGPRRQRPRTSSASAPATSRRWPRVDGVYVGPLELEEVPILAEQIRDGEAPLPDKQLLRRASADPTANSREFPRPDPLAAAGGAGRRRSPVRAARAGRVRGADAGRPARSHRTSRGPHERAHPLRRHRRARPQHPRGLRAPRRLRVAAQGAGDAAARRSLDELWRPACAAAAAPASRWARRPRSCRQGTMDKYLVCNADESEPGTFKDRELMQKTPHPLIEGIIIAAYAAGANRSFIYIRGEYAAAGRHPRRRARRGLRRPATSGENILGSGFDSQPRRAPRRGRLHLRRGDRRCSTRSRASAATRA